MKKKKIPENPERLSRTVFVGNVPLTVDRKVISLNEVHFNEVLNIFSVSWSKFKWLLIMMFPPRFMLGLSFKLTANINLPWLFFNWHELDLIRQLIYKGFPGCGIACTFITNVSTHRREEFPLWTKILTKNSWMRQSQYFFSMSIEVCEMHISLWSFWSVRVFLFKWYRIIYFFCKTFNNSRQCCSCICHGKVCTDSGQW